MNLMMIFHVSEPESHSFLQFLLIALASIFGTMVVGGTVSTDAKKIPRTAVPQDLPVLRTDHIGVYSESDTTRPRPIDVKPCSVHATYRNRENAFLPYEPVRDDVVPSLHEFTCRWAVGNDLSIDSTRLPTYVRPVGDSLRVGDALAYSVEMAAPDTLDYKDLYFVAEVGDSLFYKDIMRMRPDGRTQSAKVRSIRPIDVEGAESQYIWYEYAGFAKGEGHPTPVYEEWAGHIFSYDPRRGMRHLHFAPVRTEARTGDTVHGVRQWDVSVPEPGIMKIEPRLKKGDDVKIAPREWLGKHVIDRSATTKREVEARAGYRDIIDTTEVENWREEYEQRY